MSEFSRDLTGYRHVETMRGDSLQRIAARELGDASQWVDLAQMNGLVPPYIVDDEALLKAGVILSGEIIMVPAPVPMGTASTEPDAIFGIDISLSGGSLDSSNGDFLLCAGIANLKQAILNRVSVRKRELMFHPEYGCWVSELVGSVNGPTAGQLAAMYVKSSIIEDSRVKEASRCVATVSGDEIKVLATVVPISGAPFTFSVVV